MFSSFNSYLGVPIRRSYRMSECYHRLDPPYAGQGSDRRATRNRTSCHTSGHQTGTTLYLEKIVQMCQYNVLVYIYIYIYVITRMLTQCCMITCTELSDSF